MLASACLNSAPKGAAQEKQKKSLDSLLCLLVLCCCGAVVLWCCGALLLFTGFGFISTAGLRPISKWKENPQTKCLLEYYSNFMFLLWYFLRFRTWLLFDFCGKQLPLYELKIEHIQKVNNFEFGLYWIIIRLYVKCKPRLWNGYSPLYWTIHEY